MEITSVCVLFGGMTRVKNRDLRIFWQYGCKTTAAHVYLHLALHFPE